jgi:hypothetical protein
MSDTVVSHGITNATRGTLRIYLEPWGEEYSIAPGERVELLVERPEVHQVEWDVGEGVLVISSLAPSDALLTIRKDGVQLPAR